MIKYMNLNQELFAKRPWFAAESRGQLAVHRPTCRLMPGPNVSFDHKATAIQRDKDYQMYILKKTSSASSVYEFTTRHPCVI